MASNNKRIVLAFDGTWNNPFQPATREDGVEVLKPSNPLKIARSIHPWDNKSSMSQVVYYDTGVGALGEYPGLANKALGIVDKHFGGLLGAGFEANLEQAVTFLVNNYVVGDIIFIFGFSRGAAQARALTHFLDWMGGLPSQNDAYYVPRFFREYLKMRGTGDPSQSSNSDVRDFDGELSPVEITLLGVFDTVMSLSPRFKSGKADPNGPRSFHVRDHPAACVKHARQALAIDERRFDFCPEIWTGHGMSQTLEQRWFCGVHANIGGGYINDGLANLTYQWMIDEAEALGLRFDRTFTGKYRAFAQDTLYDSKTKLYRFAELARLSHGKGKRTLTGIPSTANLKPDSSVFTRLHANTGKNPARFDRMTRYKPDNLIALLSSHHHDLPDFIQSTGAALRAPLLPQDILDSIHP
jgi:uncharacterized protein (DUF2235 family)